MYKELVHYGIHFLVPVVITWFFYPNQRLFAFLVLLGGIVIDVDHVFATPIFDSQRCSIGFHPLHTALPILGYFLLLIPKKTRIYGLALCLHIFADITDCLFMLP